MGIFDPYAAQSHYLTYNNAEETADSNDDKKKDPGYLAYNKFLRLTQFIVAFASTCESFQGFVFVSSHWNCISLVASTNEGIFKCTRPIQPPLTWELRLVDKY